MRGFAFRPVLLTVALAVALGGCGLFEKKKKEPLPGERIPVMLLEKKLEPDPRIGDLAVRLPPPEVNPTWPQTGGYADHAMHHLTVANVPKKAWSIKIGEGSSDERRLLAQPIVAEGKVFTMDTENHVTAYETGTGKRLWRVIVVPEEAEEDAFGGGMAYDAGRVYVTTGAAEALALNAQTGDIIWRQSVTAPVRSGPTVSASRIFAVSVDNQLHALDARDGAKLWSNAGIAEVAALLGGSSPAVEGSTVVAPYTSGELVALRIDNGRQSWTDTLTAVRRADAVSALADIRGLPVIDRGRVYAISNSGRMAAIDIRSGSRIWDISVPSVQTPWVAGEFVFVLTTQDEIACISRRDGRIRWVMQLPSWADEKKQEGKVFWVGPVLASDRLIVAGSHGKILTVSPYDGKILGQVDVDEPIRIPPIVAEGVLYVLTDEGNLIAFK
ncbi:MAG: PQQ-binding-like beta-propeller repeat protein [Alphaproteobacteria bacterium]|nr:PQQ-binding-like beta-propeller repeat protein [Alphaproteobacteria bacterium]